LALTMVGLPTSLSGPPRGGGFREGTGVPRFWKGSARSLSLSGGDL
jgi:hypothetical protein